MALAREGLDDFRRFVSAGASSAFAVRNEMGHVSRWAARVGMRHWCAEGAFFCVRLAMCFVQVAAGVGASVNNELSSFGNMALFSCAQSPEK